ncbi:hypothetical protein HDK64DRAFT_332228, partial [Phyllosticta capitalensis]
GIHIADFLQPTLQKHQEHQGLFKKEYDAYKWHDLCPNGLTGGGVFYAMQSSLQQQIIAGDIEMWKTCVSLRDDEDYQLLWVPSPLMDQSNEKTCQFGSSPHLMGKKMHRCMIHAAVPVSGSASLETFGQVDEWLEIWESGWSSLPKSTQDAHCVLENFASAQRIRPQSVQIGTGTVVFLKSSSPWTLIGEDGPVARVAYIAQSEVDERKGTIGRRSLAEIAMHRTPPVHGVAQDANIGFFNLLTIKLAFASPVAQTVMGLRSWNDSSVFRSFLGI